MRLCVYKEIALNFLFTILLSVIYRFIPESSSCTLLVVWLCFLIEAIIVSGFCLHHRSDPLWRRGFVFFVFFLHTYPLAEY